MFKATLKSNLFTSTLRMHMHFDKQKLLIKVTIYLEQLKNNNTRERYSTQPQYHHSLQTDQVERTAGEALEIRGA